MAGKSGKKSKRRKKHIPKKPVEPSRRWIPAALGWETFAILYIPSAIGVWVFLEPVFDQTASVWQKVGVALVLGSVVSALLTFCANTLWQRIVGTR
ncbi:MAG: hypothetical protein J7M12_04460 [Candidatus Hydrogenedentes bacterium]|nr:hypothetical protein [Candidatus Hydrogenedentota bacterium]